MIGAFLLNPENEICYAQFGEHVRLQAVRYVSDIQTTILVREDGEEELLTEPLGADFSASLAAAKEILIACMDADGETADEYMVPVLIS